VDAFAGGHGKAGKGTTRFERILRGNRSSEQIFPAHERGRRARGHAIRCHALRPGELGEHLHERPEAIGVLAKLAPAFGTRSRSLKSVVVEGEGGQDAWNILKRRIQLVTNLK
jgi:hypothetical protein